MSEHPATFGERKPSRLVSFGVSALLVAVWAFIRLGVFETTAFPLTYAIPLLICVWTRDRLALWAMAAAFATFHTLKIFWLLPPGALSADEMWADYAATLANITIAAAVIHGIIRLRERLERALADMRAQSRDLARQSADLTRRNVELATQSEQLSQSTEELSYRGEELAAQNEELQAQAEEITTLVDVLERRERLLQTLLETARVSGTDRHAFRQIAGAAIDLFGPEEVAAAVYERRDGTLVLRALADAHTIDSPREEVVSDGFVEQALRAGQLASSNDLRWQGTRLPAALPGQEPPRAFLCAPITIDGETFGALVVHLFQPHDFTDEEFRLVLWLSEQCSRAVQALRVQAELRDADRRKTEFLAMLSHELRNPLAPLGFALDLIESTPEPNPNAILAMRRQLQQLVRLVDDLLDATRLQRNTIQIRPTNVDLNAIVEQVVAAVRPDIEAARHSLTLDLPRTPLWIYADADRIAQVVTNLLNNAIRYTPSGGEIVVRVSRKHEQGFLSVRDSGIGLDPGDVKRVFELFTQVGGSQSGGMGIGLALVRGIVEMHGGTVEARSEGKGRGTEVRVLLPLGVEATATKDVRTEGGETNHGSWRILVVDDHADSADLMGALLELRGHTVKVVHDAQSAITAAKQFAPDTALLDIGLPDMDGYELARQLRQLDRRHQMRLIAVTGWGQEQDRQRARQAGFDAHVTKPADPDTLLRVIDRVHA